MTPPASRISASDTARSTPAADTPNFNPQTGHEFSGVLGFTHNFTNQSTQYQNGVDMHFDWGASQLLTKQF